MKKRLIEIFTDEEDSFATGYLLFEDKKKLFINVLDDQGKFDGYLLIDKKLISSVEEATTYLKKLEKYQSFWGKQSLGISDNEIYKKRVDFFELIDYAHKTNKMISLSTSTDYYDTTCGFIQYIGEDDFNIKAIDQNTGKNYDDFTLNYKDIKILEIDSIDLLLLEYAYKN